MTAIILAEGLITSQPLTYQSTDPADDVPLTPNNLLHGQIGGQFAPTTVDDTQLNLQKRWRQVQDWFAIFGIDDYKNGFQVSVQKQNGIRRVETYKLTRWY